ncbi:hypothetical protein, partial [Legionella sp. 29fVS95]|uniref:hypothetical protein n=1 Tax=Legionella sp. 29fVS95 TaxID=3402813 RepID=UPI003AF8395E
MSTRIAGFVANIRFAASVIAGAMRLELSWYLQDTGILNIRRLQRQNRFSGNDVLYPPEEPYRY